jgi:hypothetical protein
MVVVMVVMVVMVLVAMVLVVMVMVVMLVTCSAPPPLIMRSGNRENVHTHTTILVVGTRTLKHDRPRDSSLKL